MEHYGRVDESTVSDADVAEEANVEVLNHLYPLLDDMEVNWPSILVELGIVLELAQQFSLVFNKSFTYGAILRGISIPLYFLILPFWDTKYDVHYTYTLDKILFWILFAGVTILVILLVACGLTRRNSGKFFTTTRLATYTMIGPLFLPQLHEFLSLMVCDQGYLDGTRRLTSYPEQQCFQGDVFWTIMFAAGVLGSLFIFIPKFVITMAVFDDHPLSDSLRARTHNVVEFWMLSYEIIAAVLYHLLTGIGQRETFAGLFAAGSFFMALLHIFYLPFMQQRINRIRVVGLACLFYCNLVNVLVLHAANSSPLYDGSNNWDAVVIIPGVLLVGVLSYRLADWRISLDFRRDIQRAQHGEVRAGKYRRRMLFPHYLPLDERTEFTEENVLVHGTNCTAANSGTLDHAGQNSRSNFSEAFMKRDQIDELTDFTLACYVEKIYVPSDVELSNRFVRAFAVTTSNVPSEQVLGFASRIYAKGLNRFVRDKWLMLQFATFLCSFTSRLNPTAQRLCEDLSLCELSPVLAYRLHRRVLSINLAVRRRQRAYRKALSKALALHKETLINVNNFWKQLKVDQVGVSHLGLTAGIIVDGCYSGMKFYSKAITESVDTYSLIRYAQFLDDVVLDAESAENTRELAIDLIEKRESGLLSDNSIPALQMDHSYQIEAKYSRFSRSLRVFVGCLCAVLFLLMAGFLGVLIANEVNNEKVLNRVESASLCRFYTMRTLFSANVAMQSSTVAPIWQTLESDLTQLRIANAAITYGSEKSMYSKVVDIMKQPYYSYFYPQLGQFEGMGLWRAGEQYISALESMVLTQSTAADRAAAYSLITSNELNGAAAAYNDSLTVFLAEASSSVRAYSVAISILYVASLAFATVVFFILRFYLARISGSRLSTLGLFRLIPRVALADIVRKMSDRIENFEAPDPVFEGMLMERGMKQEPVGNHTEITATTSKMETTEQKTVNFAPPQSNVVSGDASAADRTAAADEDSAIEGSTFAHLSRNSTVADVGRLKIHQGQHETPYQKNEFIPTEETNEEIRERKKIQEEEEAYFSTGTTTQGEDEDVEGTEDYRGLNRLVKTSSSGRSFYTPRHALLPVLAFAIALVVGGLGVQRLSATASQSSSKVSFVHTMQECIFSINDMLNAAESMAVDPSSTGAVVLFSALESVRQSSVSLSGRVESEQSVSLSTAYALFHNSFRIVYRQALAAATLGCFNSSDASLDCSFLDNTVWTADLFLPTTEPVLMDINMLLPTTRAVDTKLSQETMGQLAQNTICSPYYIYLKQFVTKSFLEAKQTLQQVTLDDINSQVTLDNKLKYVLLVMGSVLCVVLLIQLVEAGCASQHLLFVIVLSMFLLSIGSLVLTGILFAKPLPRDGPFANVVARYNAVEHLISVSDQAHEDAKQAAIGSLELGALHFETDGFSALDSAWTAVFSVMESNSLTQLTTAFSNMQYCMLLDGITVVLACQYNNFNPSFCDQPNLASLNWNLMHQSYGYRLWLKYRNNPNQMLYINRTYDMNDRSPGEQYNLSRSLLFGPLRLNHSTASSSALLNTLATYSSSQSDLVSSRYDEQYPMALCIVIFGFAIAIVSLAVAIITVISYVEEHHIRAGLRATAGSSINQKSFHDASMQRLVKSSGIVLLLFAIMLSGMFVVVIVQYAGSVHRDDFMNPVTLRSAEAVEAAVNIQFSIKSPWYIETANYFADQSVLTAEMYYRMTDMSFAKKVSELLFGSSDITFNRYSEKIVNNRSIAGFQTQSTVIAFNGLVDPSQRRWRQETLEMSQMTTAVRATMAANIYNQVFSLSDYIRDSSSEIKNQADRERTTWFIVHLTLFGVTFLVLIFMTYYLLVPVVKRLIKEEEGTHVMLRMIPLHIRESVPAIAEYMTTGRIVQDANIGEIDLATREFNIVPTIAIDAHGIITHFCRAAEELFLWTQAEAIGQNVGILMPDNIAAEHDHYIKNYLRTGEKKAIGQTRFVRAKRKDGSIFPATLNLIENRVGKNLTFVGVLRNCQEDLEFERATSLSLALTDASTIPLIVIDVHGVIMKFSKAAEVTFKCSAEEVIGRKVNVLMPRAEAEVHDRHLEKYLRTGMKTIVDTFRFVKGKRLNGEVFPAQLSVREMQHRGVTYFIGYVEDLTDRLHLEMIYASSNLTKALSPTPLIIADVEGRIQHVSESATRVFGFSETQMINQFMTLILDANTAAQVSLRYYKIRPKTPVVVTGTAKRREEADESVTSFQARVTIKFFSIQDKGDRVLVYVEDVTKRDTQQLESMVGAAVTSLSSIPIILTEDDGEMVQLNPAAESAFQMTAADAYGRNVDLLLGPYELTERASSVNRESGSDFGGGRDSVASSAQGHLSPFEQIMEDYKKTGSSSHVGRIMRGTGQTPHGERTFPVDVLVKDVTLEGRRMFLVYLRDISSDLRLLEANRWNDALMSLSQMPMVCANLEGTIFACSDTACTQFNWSREELIGENVSVLMPLRYARDHNRILENFRRSLDATAGGDLTNRAKRSILHREIVLTGRTRNGDEFPVALCVKDARIEGSEVFLVASLRDCTSEMQLTVQKNIGKAIAALSPALFVCITTTGTITEFSHSAEDHFGYTANEVIGKNIKMLMPDDVAVNHDGYLRSYEKTRVKHILDCAVTVTARHKDGSAFSVELYVTEIRNKDKSEFVGYLKNISESIALKQTVEINDVLLGLATSPMIELDRQGIITKCNGHAVREFGLTSDKDALGKKVDVLFPQVVLPDGTRSYKNWLADALDQLSDLCARNDAIHAYDNQHKTAKTSQRRSVSHSLQNSQRQFASVDRELVGRRRGGQDFQVKVTLSEISVENDADPQRVSEDARVVLCLQNIAVDMGLKMQNEMNATMTSLSRTPFVYTDADGIITSFSRAAEEVFGYVSGEAIGKPISMVLPRDMGERFMKNFVSYQVTGVKAMPDGVPHRITCCRKGGAFFPVELTVIEDVVPDGKIYFIHYFRDISTEAASASEAGLRDALTKESPVAVIVTDHEGRVEEYSQAAEALLLIPAVEFVGRNIRALEALPMALGAQEGGDGEEGDFDDDGIEGTKREFANFFYANMHQHEGQGKSIQERVRIRRGDNSTFRAEVHICSVLPYRSKLPRFIAYIVSLEDKLTIQDDLAQANGLFDATVSAVFVVSLRAAVVDYNAAAQTLLKLGAPGTSTSCPLSSLVPPGSSLLRAVHGILEKLRVEVSSDTDDEQSMVPSSTTTVNVDWSTNKNFVSQLHDVVFLAKDGSELMVNATLTIAPPCDARDEPTIIINACNTTEDRLSADCVSKEVSTLRVAGVATMEIGADGGFLFCSEGCLSVLGFRMDQLMGKQCQELMPSGYDRITPFVRNALRAIESGAPLPVVENMVFLFKRKDNAVVKMPGELRCIVKPDGSLFSVVAQLTLPLQSEQRLSELAMTAMTLSSDAVVLASLNGTIQCTNLAATQMFGVPDDVSLVGTKVTSLLADEEGKSFIRQYHRHTVSTYPTTLLAQAYSSASEDDDENVAQPHRFLVEVLLREVADAVTQAESVGGLDGSALLLVHFRNVEQEQSLLQQKKIIQTALEFSFHAVIVINAGGIISLFSEVAEDFSGVPADMAVGRDVTSLLLFEEDGHWLKSSITDLRRKGQTELLQAPRRVRVKHYEPDENGLGPVARTTTMEMTVFELHLTTADSSFEFVMYLSRLDE